jgi:hypothetical protein
MIYLRLYGGLGNQLFQIACALRFANYDENKIRVYTESLRHYDVPRNLQYPTLININLKQSSSLVNAILRLRIPKLNFAFNSFVNDLNYIKNSNATSYNTRFMDGYFQYEQTWTLIQPAVEFMASRLNANFKTKQSSGLVVHARGGDFLQDRESNEHQLKFYEKVISNGDIPEFKSGKLCCSDPSYGEKIVRKFEEFGINLKYDPKEDGDWQDDFSLIKDAKFVVGSRSTFAWWATVLGQTKSVFPCDFTIGKQRVLFHPWETVY